MPLQLALTLIVAVVLGDVRGVPGGVRVTERVFDRLAADCVAEAETLVEAEALGLAL